MGSNNAKKTSAKAVGASAKKTKKTKKSKEDLDLKTDLKGKRKAGGPGKGD